MSDHSRVKHFLLIFVFASLLLPSLSRAGKEEKPQKGKIVERILTERAPAVDLSFLDENAEIASHFLHDDP